MIETIEGRKKLKLMSKHTHILAKGVGNVSLETIYLQSNIESSQL